MEDVQRIDEEGRKADTAVRVLSLAADQQSKLTPDVIEAANSLLKVYLGAAAK